MRTVISCHTSYTFKLLAASTFTVHYEMICSPLFNDPGTSRRWREDDDPAQSPSEFPGAQVAYLLPSSTIRNSAKKLALFQDLMWLDSPCIQSLFPLSSDTQLFSHLYSSKGGSSVRATAWIPHEGWLFEKALRTLLLSHIYMHIPYIQYIPYIPYIYTR